MSAPPIAEWRGTRAQAALSATARLTWQAGRLPLLAVLTLLEPVVRAVCSLAMVLGIVAALVFEFSAAGPQFPFMKVLALSLGIGLVLVAYYGLLSLVLRQTAVE